MYAIVSLYDAETDQKIHALWDGLTAAGLPSTMPALNHPPHVTLMVCESIDAPAVRASLAQLAAGQPPLKVDYSGVAVFPGPQAVVYLALTLTRPLLDFHEAIWQAVEPHAKGISGFDRPGRWVPHTTLDYVIPIEQTGGVIEHLLRVDWIQNGPRAGRLCELMLASFDSSGIEERFRAPLAGADCE